jgi:hypothetical protein
LFSRRILAVRPFLLWNLAYYNPALLSRFDFFHLTTGGVPSELSASPEDKRVSPNYTTFPDLPSFSSSSISVPQMKLSSYLAISAAACRATAQLGALLLGRFRWC